MTKTNIFPGLQTAFDNKTHQGWPIEKASIIQFAVKTISPPEEKLDYAPTPEVDVTTIVVVGLLLAFSYAIAQKFK